MCILTCLFLPRIMFLARRRCSEFVSMFVGKHRHRHCQLFCLFTCLFANLFVLCVVFFFSNKGSQQCVDTLTTVYDDIQRVGMSGCVVENGEQLIEEQTIFFAKDTNTLRHIGEFGDKCIRAFGKTVAFIECDEQDDLVWTFDKVTGLLRHNKTGNCLLAKESGDETFEVALDACDDSDSLQTWDFLVEENFDI
eukprot:m.167287 g.167287  ORF g.167287 m.167287 type:complete len:194 (+) comp13463_c0_seq23:2101-2682(+)